MFISFISTFLSDSSPWHVPTSCHHNEWARSVSFSFLKKKKKKVSVLGVRSTKPHYGVSKLLLEGGRASQAPALVSSSEGDSIPPGRRRTLPP